MPEGLGKLHIYICIVAALTVTIVCIFKQVSLYRMSVLVSVTIIVFYGIGQMLRLFLTNMFFSKQEDEQKNDKAHTMHETNNNPVYADVFDSDDTV